MLVGGTMFAFLTNLPVLHRDHGTRLRNAAFRLLGAHAGGEHGCERPSLYGRAAKGGHQRSRGQDSRGASRGQTKTYRPAERESTIRSATSWAAARDFDTVNWPTWML